MWSIIENLVGIPWDTELYSIFQLETAYGFTCLIVAILSVVFIDLFYRIFRHIWRGKS